MKVITLTNEKGGVGKTTLALHIAAGLALMDMMVLLIDADAQSHCAHQLNVKESGGLYRLLVQDAEWKDVLREPPAAHWAGTQPNVGRLLLLPSNNETTVIPLATGNIQGLRERLEEMKTTFDAVVIDTSPTPSLLHAMLYQATDYVIYPTKCESLSLDGLAKSTIHMKQQNDARKMYGLPPVELMGVIPTMFQDTNAHSYGLDLLEQTFGISMTWRPLSQLTVWRDREYEKKTLFAYAPEHRATQEMIEVVRKVAKYVA